MRVGRKIGEDVKDRVVLRWERDKDSGLTWTQLAAPFSISGTRFREILKERGVSLPTKEEKQASVSLGAHHIRRKLRMGGPKGLNFRKG